MRQLLLALFFVCSVAFTPALVVAQIGPMGSGGDGKPAVHQVKTESDMEVDLALWQKNIGSITVTGLLDGQKVLIQPTDVFGLAKIKCDVDPKSKNISGYYIDETHRYSFDNEARTITYMDKTTKLPDEAYVVRSDGVYIRTDYFEKVFNLKCIFDFNSMGVELQAAEPLPAESEAKNASMLKTAQGFQKEAPPDKTFSLDRSWFSLGTVDYSAAGNYVNGHGTMSYNYELGGQVFGGDFNASGSGTESGVEDWRTTPWRWRTAIRNSPLVTQIVVGRRSPFSNLSLPDSMVGMSITNASTEYQSSFSNYTISDRTEPDWTVELYINDALINYTKADQTGYYKFVIPLAYGSTDIRLRFLGPYGEVRNKTIALDIPYTFLPPGQLEYTLTGGTSINNPSLKSTMSQLDMKLGISTAMTLNGGVHYQRGPLGDIELMPYAASSFRLSSGILVAGQYYFGSGYKTDLGITAPLGIFLDAEYDHPFSKVGTIVSPSNLFSVQETRKLGISAPFPLIPGSLRLNGSEQPTSSTSGVITAQIEALINVFGVGLSTSANYYFLRDHWNLKQQGEASGSIGLSFSLFGALFRPSATYNYSENKILGYQMEFLTNLGSWGSVNFTGGYDPVTRSQSYGLSLQTTLPFAVLGFSGAGGYDGSKLLPQAYGSSLAGSFGFDSRNGGFFATSRSEIGRGGVVIVPFIDQNSNGRWDKGEPNVPKFSLSQPPGQMTESADGILRVSDLEPYRKYVYTVSMADVENIALMPKFQTFAFVPPANGFARIEVPLAVAGQIEGYIMKSNGSPKAQDPLGGARLKLYSMESGDTVAVKTTEDILSYSSGEFYYLGLAPGHYRAYIDPKQLAILNASTDPPYIDFEVKNKDEGDEVDNLDFTVVQHTAQVVPSAGK